MVQIGARVPQEDAEFLATLQMEGANTPSDKLRLILAEARLRHQGMADYRAALTAMHDLLALTFTQLRQRELVEGRHSELVTRVFEWLPELLAFTLSSRAALAEQSQSEALEELEAGLAERVFRLGEAMLQLALTERVSCYQPAVLHQHLSPVLDLARVIDQFSSSQKRRKNDV